MRWEDMDTESRMTMVIVDISNEQRFCSLAGIGMIGELIIEEGDGTAATNGKDEHYWRDFMQRQNRKQARYVKLHEVAHKFLRHCINYPVVLQRWPDESNRAMDYEVNAILEQADPAHTFIEHPEGCKPLLDSRYYGMSFLDILQDLIKQGQQQPQQPQAGQGQGEAGKPASGPAGQPMDQHMPGSDDLSADEVKDLSDELDSAVRQGQILASKLAGKSGGGSVLDNAVQERDTNWRERLQDFVCENFKGDDMSRLCPPNRIMQASGHLMWGHYTERMGELLVMCDTSGSMGSIYPVVLGEIANICRAVCPESVRVIWWDTKVRGEQLFKHDQYDQIADLMKPKGGGGTTPACVAQYLADKDYNPQAGIWLTDGYLDGAVSLDFPVLWGVVDNKRFTPPQGEVVHISSFREMGR